MHRGRFIFAAALALVCAGAQAANVQSTLVNTDFTLQDRAHPPVDWQTNGTAGLSLNPSGSLPPFTLDLTHHMGNESGTAWTLLKARVPSFTMWADINLEFKANSGISGVDANCPADGVALAFANTSANAIGGGGGSMALYGSDDQIPQFIAFEVNTWRGQALNDTDQCATNKNVTFAFSNTNTDIGTGRGGGTPDAGGTKAGQVEPPANLVAKVVNGGWYRYQWNVDATTGAMQAFMTGLDDSNKAIQNLKVDEIKFAAPPINFTGRWGITAATGGAAMNTHIAHVQIVSPMVAAGAPPTAGE